MIAIALNHIIKTLRIQKFALNKWPATIHLFQKLQSFPDTSVVVHSPVAPLGLIPLPFLGVTLPLK